MSKITTDDIIKSLDLAYSKLDNIEAKRLLVIYIDRSIHYTDKLRWATERKNVDDIAYKTIDEWIVNKYAELNCADTEDIASWAVSLADTGIAKALAFKR